MLNSERINAASNKKADDFPRSDVTDDPKFSISHFVEPNHIGILAAFRQNFSESIRYLIELCSTENCAGLSREKSDIENISLYQILEKVGSIG